MGRWLLPWLALVLSGCAYHVERQWSTTSERFTPEDLNAALRGCIALHDPARLAAFDAGEPYPLSGWFLSETRVDTIYQCMRQKNWHGMPRVLMP